MTQSFVRQLLQGTLWVTLFKWTSTGLGLLSTIILARILVPDDFGIVATAALITGFFEVFSRLGTEQYLIHKTTLLTEEINTAWSIQLLAKIIISLLIVSSSFIAPAFFNEPRLAQILLALAVIPLFMGVSNIGLVLLKKEMHFKKIMLLEGVAKVISFAFIVIVALQFENYWAFVFGNIVSYFIVFIGSYIISSYRPKFCLSKASQQLSFSVWTLLKGIVNYINGRIDQLLVTKYLSVSQLGILSLSTRINALPSELFLSPLSDVLFPGLAKSLDKPAEFSERVQKLLFMIIFITLPLASLMILLAEPIVKLMLGDTDKWHMVTVVLPIIAPLIVSGTLVGKIFDTLTLLGKVKLLFIYEVANAVLSISIYLIVFYFYGDFISLVWTKLAVSLINVLAIIFILKRNMVLSVQRLILSSVPFLIVNCCAYAIVSQVPLGFLVDFHAIFKIALMGTLFALLYSLSIFAVLNVCRQKSKDIEYIYQFCLLGIDKFLSKRKDC